MRGFTSICAVVLVVLLPSAAFAAESSAAVEIARVTPESGEGIRAVVTGLRQTIIDNGISTAITRASDWVKELEVSWNAHRNGEATGFDMDTDFETTPGNGPVFKGLREAMSISGTRGMSWGPITLGTSTSQDQAWAIGHSQPVVSSITAGSAVEVSSGLVHTDSSGTATAERSLASHDIAFGMQVPGLPWNTQVSADHYWWGARGFGQQIEGNRVSLKFSPVANVEVEGGRSEDKRGSGGFFGVLYRVQLDPTH
jgi:hypothetical protein